MYKLVVVGGRLRGEEFLIEEKESTLGRDSECEIYLPIAGISKRHFKIYVSDEVAFIEDLGSANGTFVNGKIVKRGTIKDKDKIALPDCILQVVYIEERKVIIKKSITSEDDDADPFAPTDMPDSILGKIIFYFKFKIMPIAHNFNHEYEWKILFAIFLCIFVVVNISLTIFPILSDSKILLLHETAKRGAHYAEEIGRINSRALEKKNIDQVDTHFLDNEDGVESYELFDLEGRIVRPLGKINEYISDPFSVQTKEWAMKTKLDNGKRVLKKILDKGEIGIGKKIMAYNSKLGVFEPVGVIAIRFAPRSLAIEAVKSSKAYLESLITSGLVAILFFAIIYYLTVRPIDEMKYQIEMALRGKIKNLTSDYLMLELNPLRNSINAVLQKIRELQNDSSDSEFEEMEEDITYVAQLGEFMRGAGIPCMVLNSEKNLERINLEGEDLCGIRESSAQGSNILDVAREKGFAATLIELCDNSANNGGTSQEGEYELQGTPTQIYVTSLIGKDNFAKAFYITFVTQRD